MGQRQWTQTPSKTTRCWRKSRVAAVPECHACQRHVQQRWELSLELSLLAFLDTSKRRIVTRKSRAEQLMSEQPTRREQLQAKIDRVYAARIKAEQFIDADGD